MHPLRAPNARRLAAVIPLLLALVSHAAVLPQDEGADPQREMQALLDQLAVRADLYRTYALGFACTESVIRSFYNSEKGSFRRRDQEVYDYIFTEEEGTGALKEDRVLIEENGKATRKISRELEMQIPPAYAWADIFSVKNRGKFLFRPAGKELKGYRLLIHLDFVGSAAIPGGRDIAGWSGKVSVDSSTLNLHSILAEPSGQAARVEAETLKYQRAFAIMGVPLASKPRTETLEVVFGLEQQGLTYPTESTLEKNVYVTTGQQAREERTMLRYRDYRFFKVGTREDEVRESTDPDDDGSDPPE